MKNSDEFWMARCIELAKRGAGYVSPNPLVGAVFVKDGKKISEGYHRLFGGHHAEINAINKALKRKRNLAGATLYVNLEPCFHIGKTPPCVDAVIQYGISRVVIATKDPNPLVAGRSIKKLEKNGIKCLVGILEHEAKQMNEKFFKFIKTENPFVALKAAQTSDGFIAQADSSSRWITNSLSREYVHHLRSEYDAVIVGANTVTTDDPELTVRNVKGRNPVRVIIDGRLSVDLSNRIFNNKAPSILYTAKSNSKKIQNKILELDKKGVVVVQLKENDGTLNIKDILRDLGKHQISSVLVEGGSKIYSEFLNSELVDKVYLFTAKKKYGYGLKTFKDNSKTILLKKIKEQYFGTDLLEEFSVHTNGKNGS
jgi:diaminohydroxyphosphoribosylaminopyrimidine deaminase / 5-amino-6-(5-phosphoribosylamino)uracil reductase